MEAFDPSSVQDFRDVALELLSTKLFPVKPGLPQGQQSDPGEQDADTEAGREGCSAVEGRALAVIAL